MICSHPNVMIMIAKKHVALTILEFWNLVFSETSSTTLRWALLYLTLNPKVSQITTTIPFALLTHRTTTDSQPQCPTTPLSSRCKHGVRRRWTNWGRGVQRLPIWLTFHIARWSCCQFQDGDILVPSQGPQHIMLKNQGGWRNLGGFQGWVTFGVTQHLEAKPCYPIIIYHEASPSLVEFIAGDNKWGSANKSNSSWKSDARYYGRCSRQRLHSAKGW